MKPKDKHELERLIWPIVRPDLNLQSQTRNGHGDYMRLRREFQKQLNEHLSKNSASFFQAIMQFDISQEDLRRMFSLEISLRRRKR